MVEDRDHHAAAVGHRPDHLDLAVATREATIQLEDSSRPRRAAGHDLRALAQLTAIWPFATVSAASPQATALDDSR